MLVHITTSGARAFYQAFSTEAHRVNSNAVAHRAEFCEGLYYNTARHRYIIRACVSEDP